MSTNSTALACKLEDLKQLENKPYLKFQTHLYDYDIDHLPDNLYRLKSKLARLQKTDRRHNKGVVISQCRLAKLLGKSRETINRLLKQLEQLGHVRITKNKYSKGLYNNQLSIEVVHPVEAYEYVRDNVADITEGLRATRMSQGCDENITHLNNNRNNTKANIKSNIRETSPADNFEPVVETAEPSDIVPNVPCETFVEPERKSDPEPQAEVARFITKEERRQIVTKVKAMNRDNEIHPNVQANYQDITVLVQHIIIHCVYRNVLRYKNFKHALNTAAKLIRNGTWTTPKRALVAETAERERLANEAKELERRQCLDSGMGRILGEAMRLTHGPSDTDIAKLKADLLERGVNSLGQNASTENIARLKEIIQKTVENKRKGLKK
jgi:biotin operon repressor